MINKIVLAAALFSSANIFASDLENANKPVSPASTSIVAQEVVQSELNQEKKAVKKVGFFQNAFNFVGEKVGNAISTVVGGVVSIPFTITGVVADEVAFTVYKGAGELIGQKLEALNWEIGKKAGHTVGDAFSDYVVKPIVGGAVQCTFGGLGYVAQLVADKAYEVLPGFGKSIIDGAQKASNYVANGARNAVDNLVFGQDTFKNLDLFEGIDVIA